MKKNPDLANEQQTNKDKNSIQVITRVSAIMTLLSEHKEGLSLTAIAKEVGLPRSTVQRFIHTLEQEDLVESLGHAGGFRLGPALGRLINRTQTDIIDVVRPYLTQLSQSINETVMLSHLSGIHSRVIEQVVAENIIRIVIPYGEAPVFGCKLSDGQAILSRYNDGKLQELLKTHLSESSDEEDEHVLLLKKIDKVREEGVAIIENNELHVGMSMMSVPLETYMGIYAITIVVPAYRFTDRVDEFKKQLTEIQVALEHKIGI